MERIGVGQSLITRMGILSIPGDCLEAIDATMLSICLLSAVFSVNLSDKGWNLGSK